MSTLSPSLAPTWARSSLSAWSTRMEVVVTEPTAVACAGLILRTEVERMDLLASRFREDSELARLHRLAGRPAAASDELIELLELSCWVATVTDGAVDPTVGAALCRLGFDRDFTAISARLRGEVPAPSPVPGWRCIEIDRDEATVRIPSGVVLDLGATAKALVADRVAERVWAEHGCGVLVSIGGDIAVAGAPRGGFAVGVADRCDAAMADAAVSLTSGGLATSGLASRRWQLGQSPMHHVIDPATGLPVRELWRTVSVTAASCVEANAASAAALVKGRRGPAWLAKLGLPARLVEIDGTVCRIGAWPDDDRCPAPVPAVTP